MFQSVFDVSMAVFFMYYLVYHFRERNVLKSASRMDVIEYTPVTESLLGNGMLLPSNGSRPMEMMCDEYLAYVDELLRNISQQVCNSG